MWVGGVRVIVTDEEGRVLMVRQHHEGRDIWMLPGGGIEEGENAFQGAVREVKEETGLDVSPVDLIWHVEEVSEKRGQRFVVYLLAKVVGGKLSLGQDPEFDQEHQVLNKVEFLPLDRLVRLENLYPEFLREELVGALDKINSGQNVFKVRK